MLNFQYKGISQDNKYVEGEIEAINNAEAAHKLKEQKVIITKLTEFKKKKKVDKKKKVEESKSKTIPEKTEASNTGPYDVELGFLDNKLWLFQIRPFVENKNAKSSTYLQSISPELQH